jgi:hypothetical protein
MLILKKGLILKFYYSILTANINYLELISTYFGLSKNDVSYEI